jgi:hypothetical protein
MEHVEADGCLTDRSLALCTWGADGAALLSRPGDECIHCPATPPGEEITVKE